MRLPLLLFLVLPLAFAATDYAIVPIAAMLAVFIVGLAYMFSQQFQNSQLEAWAKNEWKELIIAGIVVGLIYSAAVVSTGQIVGTTTGYADKDALFTAANQSFHKFQQNLSKDYTDTIKVANRLGMITSYSYTATGGYIFTFGSMSGPYLGASGLMQSLAVLANSLSTGIMIYSAMLLFLKFFFDVSMETILPIAFALRFIPFTRKIGGTLIALALAGIFVYPIAMALVADIHDNINVQHSKITGQDLNTLVLDLPSSLVEMCKDPAIRLLTSLSEWGWWAAICFIYCAVICASATVAYAVCYAGCIMPVAGLCWNQVSYPFYNYAQLAFMNAASMELVSAAQRIQNSLSANSGVIYDIIMHHLIIPASNAATVPIMEAVLVGGLTIVGARSLSAALGGEMAIAGLERLV